MTWCGSSPLVGSSAASTIPSVCSTVLQAGDREVLVENVTDAARLGYAALRVLRQRAETICFVTGHGETFRPMRGHCHHSWRKPIRTNENPDRYAAAICIMVRPDCCADIL
jgi:hypothetical protein